jgi:DNA-directed RNA polymerase specialized sigma subunit
MINEEMLIIKLKSINIDRGKIFAIQERLARLEEKYDIDSISYDSDRVTNSNISNPTEEKAVMIAEEREMLMRKKKQLEDDVRLLIQSINYLPDIEKAIIIEHYLNKKTIGEISDELNYSERHITRLKKYALIDLLEMLNGD